MRVRRWPSPPPAPPRHDPRRILARPRAPRGGRRRIAGRAGALVMTQDDFRAMSLEALSVWIHERAAYLNALQEWLDLSEHERVLAYRVLKEKMAK